MPEGPLVGQTGYPLVSARMKQAYAGQASWSCVPGTQPMIWRISLGGSVEDYSIIGIESEERDIELVDCQAIEETESLAIGIQATKGPNIIEDGEEINERQDRKSVV